MRGTYSSHIEVWNLKTGINEKTLFTKLGFPFVLEKDIIYYLNSDGIMTAYDIYKQRISLNFLHKGITNSEQY